MSNADASILAHKLNEILGSHVPVILFMGKKALAGSSILASRPWSCVVTSLQNENLLYDFTIENKRRVSAIDDYAGMLEEAKLSQREMTLAYIYGRDEIKSLSFANRRRRDQDAASMLKMLPDMVKSNFGYIVITGFDEEDAGEINFSYLFDAIELMRKGSVLMFGVQDSLWQNELFIELQNDGKLEAVSATLPELLTEMGMNASPDDEYVYHLEQDENSVFFYINGKRTSIGLDDLFETKGFITLLSETEIGDTSYPSYMKQDYFYNFLRTSPQEPVWLGYENEFNLERDFEAELHTVVKIALQGGKDPIHSLPILLSGQTSSSKSMVLGHLAYRIYREKTYPVLYIKNPDIHLDRDSANFSALDMLIQHLEAMGARRILLVWDNSSAFNQKREAEKLQTNLQNKGRKTILLCSSYEYPEEATNNKFTVIKSSIDLKNNELQRLRELVMQNGNISAKEFDVWSARVAPRNLLALLYNLLREHIDGVGREADFGMSSFFDQLGSMSAGEEKIAMTDIGLALQNVGYKLSDFSKGSDESIQALELTNKIRNFFVTIAICSQYNIALPLYMALRALKLDMDNRFAAILRAIESVPCLRVAPLEADDSASDRLISFRTSLEASLYLQSAGISSKEEVEHIVRLILETSGSSMYSLHSEIAVIEKVIRIIGPNTEKKDVKYKYSPYYRDVVQALTDLRTKRRIKDPRLICQEVTWLREIYGVGVSDYGAEITVETKKLHLKKAIQLAGASIDTLRSSTGRFNKGAIGALLVEKVLCEMRLYDLSRMESQTTIPLTFDYRELYNQLSSSIGSDPTNLYRRNALMKLFFTFYENATIVEEEKIQYLGRILSIVDFVESQLGDSFDDEEYKGHLLRLKELEDSNSYNEYFERLVERGEAVGVFLKARKILEKTGINLKNKVSKGQIQSLQEVLDFLKKYESASKNHPGCQYMQLRLTWLLYNGSPPFSGEEMQRTRMSDQQWREILSICVWYEQQFLRAEEQLVNASAIYYLQALSYAQLGEFHNSLESFEKIERTAGGFHTAIRNKVWHLLCDDQGHTKKYKGSLEEKFYDRVKKKGRVRVEAIGGVYFYGPSLKLARFSGAFADIEIGTSFMGFEAFRKLEVGR